MKVAAHALILMSLLGVSLAGCGQEVTEPAPQEAARSQDALIFSPAGFFRIKFDLIGRGLNGQGWNGEILDGHWVVEVSLDDVVLPNGRTRDLWLRQTRFQRGRAWGRLGTRRVVGTVFSATLDDGRQIDLRIDGMERSAEPDDSDVLYYYVSYPADGGWQPLCGVDERGSPMPAIPLSGRWSYLAGVEGGGAHIDDDSVFTFGCTGFVLAKCVEMGYKPWVHGWACDGQSPGRSGCFRTDLENHHQSCVRAMRADYCGDGTSYTDDGLEINLYDDFGIRGDTEDWTMEAEWTPQGARCMSASRTHDVPPYCWDELLSEDCGDPSHFATGTVLMTELP